MVKMAARPWPPIPVRMVKEDEVLLRCVAMVAAVSFSWLESSGLA